MSDSPEFFFPEGKYLYKCPGCLKAIEEDYLYDLVVYTDRIEAYHKGCYSLSPPKEEPDDAWVANLGP